MTWADLRSEVGSMFDELSSDANKKLREKILERRAARSKYDRERVFMRTQVAEHEICKICGKQFTITLEHKNRGRHPETCSPRCRGVMHRDGRIMVDGEMLTVNQIANRYGLPVATVAYRVRAGIVDVTSRTNLSRRSSIRAMVDGEMLTAIQIAKRYGLPASTVVYRIEAGIADVTRRSGLRPRTAMIGGVKG